MWERPVGNRTGGVFVLDDHEAVCGGIRDLIEAEPDLAVAGGDRHGARGTP